MNSRDLVKINSHNIFWIYSISNIPSLGFILLSKCEGIVWLYIALLFCYVFFFLKWIYHSSILTPLVEKLRYHACRWFSSRVKYALFDSSVVTSLSIVESTLPRRKRPRVACQRSNENENHVSGPTQHVFTLWTRSSFALKWNIHTKIRRVHKNNTTVM